MTIEIVATLASFIAAAFLKRIIQSSLDNSSDGTKSTTSNRTSRTKHGETKSCFSFRSFIFRLIIFCSATSNHLIVEPFVASRPMAESAFSKSTSANLSLKPGRFYGHIEPVYFHNVLTHSASFSRGRVFIGSTFAQKFLEAHTESLLKRFIHSIDSRLSFSSPPCGRRLESDSICSPNEPEPLEPEQEPSEPSEPVPVPKPESELIEQEPVEPSSSRMAFANTENTVEPSSSRMPKMVPKAAASTRQANQLLAPPINGRAKSNSSKEYEKGTNLGDNVEFIIGYCVQPCIFRQIKKYHSDTSLQGRIPRKYSLPSLLSNAKSNDDEPASVRIKMPCILIPQRKYFIPMATPENCTNDQPSSNCEGEYHAQPSLQLNVVLIHHPNFSSEAPSEHKKCADILPIFQMPPSTTAVCCCVAISSNPLPLSCEGDSHVRPTLSKPVPSYLGFIVASINHCRVLSSNQTMHHPPLDCEGDCSHSYRQIIDQSSASGSAHGITPAASRKALPGKEKGLVHHAIEIRHPIHYIAKMTYHEKDSKHAQQIYVQEVASSSTSSRLDLPKRINFATKRASLQKRHRKAIPVISLPKLSSISTPSILEGEVPAKMGIFQLVEYKTEDCESRIEHVGQNADESEKEIMQSKFRHHNYVIDCHANFTSRTYLLSPLFYYAGNSITHRESSWLPRETPLSVSAIAIQFRRQGKFILQATSAALAATAEKSLAASMAAALIATTIAISIVVTRKKQRRKFKRQHPLQYHRRQRIIMSKSIIIKHDSPPRHIAAAPQALPTILIYLPTATYDIRAVSDRYPWHEVLDFPLFHVHRIFLSTHELLLGFLLLFQRGTLDIEISDVNSNKCISVLGQRVAQSVSKFSRFRGSVRIFKYSRTKVFTFKKL